MPDATAGLSITVTGGAGTVDYPLTAGTDGTIYWSSVSPGGTVFKMRQKEVEVITHVS